MDKGWVDGCERGMGEWVGYVDEKRMTENG